MVDKNKKNLPNYADNKLKKNNDPGKEEAIKNNDNEPKKEVISKKSDELKNVEGVGKEVIKYDNNGQCEKVMEIGEIVIAPMMLGDWMITHQIGEGTFAKIFVGRSLPFDQYYAVKIEVRLTSMDFIDHEVTVMRLLSYPNELPHIPKCVFFSKQKDLNFFVMTLLGENLRDLKLKCPDRRFLRGTWSRLGIQILYALKLMHEKGFIHRDIKPENLLMGAADDRKRSRIVHVIDFGLTRQWAWSKEKAFYARPLRTKVQFRGSLNFTSSNAHLGYKLGRKDDLWSLLFTLVDLNDRLPWHGVKDHMILARQKMNMGVALMKMPKTMERFFEHLLECRALQRPNYHMMFNILKGIQSLSEDTPTSKYTFEEVELSEDDLEERFTGEWEEVTGEFFAIDEVKINNPEKCSKLASEWKNPDVDVFQSASKNQKGSKMMLSYEFRLTGKNEEKMNEYAYRWEKARERYRQRMLRLKLNDRNKQQFEAKNYMEQQIENDRRDRLDDIENVALKYLTTEGANSDEKDAEVNMSELHKDRNDVLRDAQKLIRKREGTFNSSPK
ncbi:non-specific serine/threonine protein kinase [Caenorhabditis elegans]|uniref:non-specific serine/threonine protein kinase n=1 Tax=Caenorhabditis elegans TaxID=6239 RepID=A0A061ACJ5_CAEEL|nr:Protein kinase domain-containing protein [Caenorhabditis elegans]CDR32641.1 Protein kinase domain-containing protein [Caenorhabditis elegans]|eukprot:NP_001293885.1 Tau TuBulin Kinase [Caenorhabditis elegans]